MISLTSPNNTTVVLSDRNGGGGDNYGYGLGLTPSTCNSIGSIITMAKAWGLAVIAVGIEDQGHAAMLRELNCDFGQGYFHRQLATDCAEEVLERIFTRRGYLRASEDP